MTSGEKRFAKHLEGKREDDYLRWHEVPSGERARHSSKIEALQKEST